MKTHFGAHLRKGRYGNNQIPYKSNRAFLFDGAYFHQTIRVSMKEGIENRRVSYTMLFGSQLE